MWTTAQIKTVGEPYCAEYTSADYNTTGQVWCSLKDKRGVMYFGSNTGLIVYDGNYWNTVQMDKEIPIMSLAMDTVSGKIYVGAMGDFGYLECNDLGSYEFKSIFDKIPDQYSRFSNIRKIIIDENEGIIYEARTALYIFKDDNIRVITPTFENEGIGVYKTGGKVYIYSPDSGIKLLHNGKVTDLEKLSPAKGSIVTMDELDGRLLIVNQEKGIFIYQNDSLANVQTSIPDNFIKNLLCIHRTHDNHYIFGSGNQGIIITDKDLNPIKWLNINGSLSIYEDNTHLVWVTTSTKIITIDLFSPFTWFPNTATGITSSVRSSIQVGDELFIGSDAVFNIHLDSLSNPKFSQLKNNGGTGSVWKLDTICGVLTGCCRNGIFTIDTNNVMQFADRSVQLRNFIVPRSNPDIILGTAGGGISVFEGKNGRYKYNNALTGFDYEMRQIAEDCDGAFLASQRILGVFRISPDSTFQTATYQKFTTKDGLPDDVDNYVFNIGKEIVICTKNGIYKYDADSAKFVENERLNQLFGGKKQFDLLYNDNRGSLWVKHVVTSKRAKKGDDWLLERYKITSDTSAEITDKIFLPFMNHIVSFNYIGGGCYIIGDVNGFVHYDENFQKDINQPYKALIRKVENIYNDSLIYGGDAELFDGYTIKLPYDLHSIRVRFSAAYYEHPQSIRFKSYLEGNDDSWSDFRSENYKEYPNLSPGKYTLHVIASNIYNVDSQEATITFEILPPWYLTIWAKIFYALLFVLAIWLFVKAYTKKLIHDKEKLEKIVEERTAEIRKQSQLILEKNEEITAKNKEITDSIKYAQRIQTAMLPMEERIQAVLPDHFILFRPKDIVSGDYYWFAETENSIIITAADCTGHGVPGAFMSMIGSQILTEIVVEGITSPEQILTNQNRRIRKALKQDTTANQDGMDMALCTIDKKTHLVEYSGAKNQLVVIQNGELTEYKADKQSIGGQQLYGDDFQYKKVAIQPDGNTWFYMFSDGYKDQFGGANNTKFLIKNLRALFMQIHDEPPAKQREILNETIEKWIKDGNTEQTDDIIIIGFKL